jgi:enoyl-CoA hydratase
VQSTRMLEELDHAIDAAGADRGVRVICLFGAGKHFSAGHDLGSAEEKAHREKYPLEEGARGFFDRTWRLYVDMHLRWRNVPKPMICAVQGYCIFGGWMVASTADIIFAADDALFLGSAFQYFSIPYDIHPRMAKELLFQSRFINAQQARELGLVNRVIAPDRLVEETLEYAADVAGNDPFDLRTTKLAINQALDAQGFTIAPTWRAAWVPSIPATCCPSQRAASVNPWCRWRLSATSETSSACRQTRLGEPINSRDASALVLPMVSEDSTSRRSFDICVFCENAAA